MKTECIGAAAPVDGPGEDPSAAEGCVSSEPLLPDPISRMLAAGDPAAEVAALLLLSLREDRRAARKLMQADEQGIARQGAERVAALRAKAGEIRAEGWAAGIGELAQGGLGLAGAAGFAAPAVGEHDWAKAFDGGGTFARALSRPIAAGHSAEASLDETEATRHEAGASAATRAYDRHRDEVDEVKGRLKRVIDFIGAAQEAQNASRRAALRA